MTLRPRALLWRRAFDPAIFGTVVCRLVSVAGTTASSAILISALTPRELGLYFSLSTYGYIAHAAIGVSLDQRLQRMYLLLLRKHSFPTSHYLGVVARFALAGLAAALLAAPWTGAGSVPILLLLAAATFLLAGARSFNIILNRQRTLNLMVLAEGLCKPALLAAALFWIAPESHVAALLAYALTLLGVATLGLALLTRHARSVPPPAAAPVLESLRFMAPIGTGALLNLAQLQGYRAYFANTGELATVGIYASVANLGGVVVQALGAVYNQLAMRRLYEPDDPAATQSYFSGAVLLLLGCTVVTAVASPVFLHLFKPSFAPFWHVALFGVLVEGGNLILGAIGLWLSVNQGKTRLVLLFSLVGLMTTAAALALARETPQAWQLGAAIGAGQLAAVGSAWLVLLHARGRQ